MTVDEANYSLSAQDTKRLKRQIDKVAAFMADGYWHTLDRIADAAGGSQAGVSARLRELRKLGHTIERRRVPGKNGLWEYRMFKTSDSQPHTPAETPPL